MEESITIIGTTNGIDFSSPQRYHQGIFEQIKQKEFTQFPDTNNIDSFIEILQVSNGHILFSPGYIHKKIKKEIQNNTYIRSLISDRNLKIGFIKIDGTKAIKPVIRFSAKAA